MSSFDRRLRVLYVNHTAALTGCAASLKHLIQHLPRDRVDAYVLTPDGPACAGFIDAGATVIKVPGVAMLLSVHGIPLRGGRLVDLLRTAWNLRTGPLIRRAIREVQPDIVHLNERGMFQAALVARRAGLPVIVHARSVADRRTRWVHRFSVWWMRRWADHVVAIDESVRHSLRELPKMSVIYNPLDLRSVGPRARSPDSREIRVSYLTGLLAFKGIGDLLEAARLLRHRPDIIFQIAGANSRPEAFHGSLVGRVSHLFGLARDVETPVRAFVEKYDLQSVQLLGHVTDSGALLAATDILVFPSHLNGPGRSVFEAGALGIPAVVALEDRIEDVVEDGVNGIIVSPRKPELLAEAIVRLADDAVLRRITGEAARRKYIIQFDPARASERTMALYASLTPEGRAAGVLRGHE